MGRRDGGRNSWSARRGLRRVTERGVVSCSEHLHAFPLRHSPACLFFFSLPSFLLLCPSHSKMSCKGAPLSTRCRHRQHRSRTTNNHILLFLVAVIEVAVCDSRSLLRLICFNSMLGLHISLRSPVGRCLAFLCSPV